MRASVSRRPGLADQRAVFGRRDQEVLVAADDEIDLREPLDQRAVVANDRCVTATITVAPSRFSIGRYWPRRRAGR